MNRLAVLMTGLMLVSATGAGAQSWEASVLAGVTAVSSGQTIYDPAIANTVIDQEQARFDPNLDFNNRWNRVETPADPSFLDDRTSAFSRSCAAQGRAGSTNPGAIWGCEVGASRGACRDCARGSHCDN